MSPSGLGRRLKPFVFLDLFDAGGSDLSGFGWHPHSGIATLTYLWQGSTRYEDTTGAAGLLPAGGVEWFKAAGGAWHGGGAGQFRPLARLPAVAGPAAERGARPLGKHLSEPRGNSVGRPGLGPAGQLRGRRQPARGAVADQLSRRAPQGRRDLALRSARRPRRRLDRFGVGQPCGSRAGPGRRDGGVRQIRPRRSNSAPRRTASSSWARPRRIRTTSCSAITRSTPARQRSTPPSATSPKSTRLGKKES